MLRTGRVGHYREDDLPSPENEGCELVEWVGGEVEARLA